MIIKCLFIVRSKTCGPELLVAWDEYIADENREGWRVACCEAMAEVENEIIGHAYVDLDLKDSDLAKALETSVIPGVVL
jgi:hypothetical protein